LVATCVSRGASPTAAPWDLAGSGEAPVAFVDLQANDALRSALNLDQGATADSGASDGPRRGPSIRLSRGSAAEQVLAAELKGRDDASDALSMMVSSMVHMVQAGKTRSNGSRWSA